MQKVAVLSEVSDNAEEKLTALKAFWETLWPGVIEFGIDLLIGILILLLGKIVIKVVLKITKKVIGRSKCDAGVASFIGSIIKVALYVVLLIVIAAILGIPTASLITLLGSAGLAIGLALQGSLSNFAGGVLILLMKPFRVGDFIESVHGKGTVSSIDIFYTKLITPDNRAVVIPNGALSNGSITNYSKEPLRRIDLVIPISYKDDIKKAKSILEQISLDLGNQANKGATEVFVGAFGADAIEITYRVWVDNDDYWPVRAQLLERVKESFDENGISIPYHQMEVMIKQ